MRKLNKKKINKITNIFANLFIFGLCSLVSIANIFIFSIVVFKLSTPTTILLLAGNFLSLNIFSYLYWDTSRREEVK